MIRIQWRWSVFAGAVACVLAAWALYYPASAQAAEGSALESQVKEFRLSNGLLFLVVERPFAPIFSFVTLVDAGAVDEPMGKTGIAHMMEHMAFKGSPKVGTTDAKAEAAALDRVDDAWDAVLEQKRLALFQPADSGRMAATMDRFKAAQAAAQKYVVGNAFSKAL
jgi:predicted Zn-dependent peptidase